MKTPLSAAAHPGTEWNVVRLPSALDAQRSSQRRRPWLSRTEEQAKQEARIARVRRENGIPAPDEWMW